MKSKETHSPASQKHFRKLCQLCSPNFSKEEILSEEIDWQATWKLALRHRVAPVRADRIKQLDLVVPDDMTSLIADNIQKNLHKGMKQTAELINLTKLLGEHDIPFVVFKGIALLKVMGLELHHRLLSNTHMFFAEPKKIHENHSVVKINSNDIPVMNQRGYLFYSLIHGAVSHWLRLKWLCDIIPISGNGNYYQSLSLLEEAKTLGIERVILQGLGLSNALLAMPVSDQVKEHLSQNRYVPRLMDHAQSTLNGNEPGQDTHLGLYRTFQTYLNRIVNYELRLRSDLMYKVYQVRGYSTDHFDWEVIQLPSQFFFLYYPLRPFLWLRRRL